MQLRAIGNVQVSGIGLGEMPMSIEGRPEDRQQSIRTIHAALDAGVTFIDTADAYSMNDADFGHGEALVAEALKSAPAADVLVATKGGHTRRPDGSWGQNGDPKYLKQAVEASLQRLGVEAIGLYQFHRPDPKVPFEDSVGALADLLDEGKVRMAGVSNFDVDQIRAARDILGGRLASVQNQYSPAFLSSRPELDLCDELGIAFLPWSPLGGISSASDLGQNHNPFQDVAAEHDVSPQRVALAWMLATSPVVIPIPGSSRPETITDSAAAADLVLLPDEIAALNTILD